MSTITFALLLAVGITALGIIIGALIWGIIIFANDMHEEQND